MPSLIDSEQATVLMGWSLASGAAFGLTLGLMLGVGFEAGGWAVDKLRVSLRRRRRDFFASAMVPVRDLAS